MMYFDENAQKSKDNWKKDNWYDSICTSSNGYTWFKAHSSPFGALFIFIIIMICIQIYSCTLFNISF